MATDDMATDNTATDNMATDLLQKLPSEVRLKVYREYFPPKCFFFVSSHGFQWSRSASSDAKDDSLYLDILLVNKLANTEAREIFFNESEFFLKTPYDPVKRYPQFLDAKAGHMIERMRKLTVGWEHAQAVVDCCYYRGKTAPSNRLQKLCITEDLELMSYHEQSHVARLMELLEVRKPCVEKVFFGWRRPGRMHHFLIVVDADKVVTIHSPTKADYQLVKTNLILEGPFNDTTKFQFVRNMRFITSEDILP